MKARRYWTDAEVQMLRDKYADSKTEDIAAMLGRSVDQVYQKAYGLGLAKSPEYLSSPAACRLGRGQGGATRFKPGHQSWSKGLKGVVGVQEACRATQFKPGTKPHTWVPIGSLRVNGDGYLDRKVTDDGRGPRDWVAVHRLVWIEANGPVPDGHVVVFKRGRRTAELAAITVNSVELVTRTELMRRNSVHSQYPPEVARLVQLRGALTRQINKQNKDQP